MYRELQFLLLVLLLLSGLGWLFGSATAGLLTGLTGYIVWHLYNLYQLYRVDQEGWQFPDSVGLWDEVFRRLHRRYRRQRQRIRRLRKTIKRFEDSSAALPDAVLMLDKRFHLEWCNQAGVDLLGIRIPGDIGQRITNVVRSPELADLLESEDDYAEFEDTGPLQRIFSAHLIPYLGKRKLLVVRDISRQQAIERMHHNFVANTSHELRTPLTVLKGYLETLQDSNMNLPESWHRPVAQMAEQAQRMESIITDMLVLTKLENGAVATESKQEIRPAELVRKIIEEGRAIAAPKQLEIKTDLDNDLRLFAREGELRSAFSNLIMNAVQYTPAGGTIEIEWRREPDCLQFTVRDNGEGIAPEHIEHLTERFYRVDVGQSRAIGGTGLGLAIVKQIATLYGGALTIDSEPGKGSCFRLELPLKWAVDSLEPPSRASAV